MHKKQATILVIFFALVFIISIFGSAFVSAFNWNDGSLVVYYKLDELSGNTVHDSTGNYNGTNYGATVGVAGKINTAYQFDGISNYVNTTLTTDQSSSSNKTFSFSVWANTTDNSTLDVIIGGDGGNVGYQLWYIVKLKGVLSSYS